VRKQKKKWSNGDLECGKKGNNFSSKKSPGSKGFRGEGQVENNTQLGIPKMRIKKGENLPPTKQLIRGCATRRRGENSRDGGGDIEKERWGLFRQFERKNVKKGDVELDPGKANKNHLREGEKGFLRGGLSPK